MSEIVEINPGEVQVKFSEAKGGKLTFSDLGLKAEDLFIKGGMLRLVFNMDQIKEHDYYKIPTVEITYDEEVGKTHWQCDFNEETILDKIDNHGHSTILLMDRKKIGELEHHHQNRLIVHGEFPEPVHIDVDKSYINLFK